MENVECVDLDLSLPQYQVYLYALRNATIVNGTLKSKFRFSLAYARRLEKNFDRLLKTSGPLDAIIEIIDPVVTREIPCYFYQDVSVDMLIRYYREHGKPRPQFEMFSMDDLLRWRDRQRRMYEACAGVFCMSRSLAESLVTESGLPPSKVHLVHAGVHVQPQRVSEPPLDKQGQPMILFVGRDFFRKAGDLVVEAFQILRKGSFPRSKLVVAGPQKWPLRGPIPPGVIFLGDASWPILQQYYSFADLFCMPSRTEGFGIVFLEALCYGIPCIARKDPVLEETIQHGENGFLLEHDDPAELARLMKQALNDPSLRERLHARVLQYQQYYSWSRVAGDMIQVVQRDLAGFKQKVGPVSATAKEK